jgi:hypothetical protein
LPILRKYKDSEPEKVENPHGQGIIQLNQFNIFTTGHPAGAVSQKRPNADLILASPHKN